MIKGYKKGIGRNVNKELYNIIDILSGENGSFLRENGKINMDIVNNIEKAASNLSYKRVTGTSIRNIYNAFKNIEMKINQNYLNLDDLNNEENLEEVINSKLNESFLSNKPIIKLLNSKINYLIARKVSNTRDYDIKKAYYGLYEFIETSINVICSPKNDVREFTAFLKVFEAMYGYLDKGVEK
ncbi:MULTISPECIES: type III-A CRISPR-associated protein Csm2 [Clostridium]|uniref:type III-A CRISPR-associated protein Csm2 n=1 Tax=Clostridium TaxID=1485 RepID=UPI000824FD4B|nr:MULTISPECIES: type III-A CRISPR-associated protein Csm2 [Clostridium]PJI06541.1 type III-A CRISPR-associated protein Csm2 [Clostridium sp. CT7]